MSRNVKIRGRSLQCEACGENGKLYASISKNSTMRNSLNLLCPRCGYYAILQVSVYTFTVLAAPCKRHKFSPILRPLKTMLGYTKCSENSHSIT
ncbi:hypothetical protein RJ639_019154 [Escallonia herrerae]|uniref:Uncharacterized protein n=1 Tax=Escallonia herrerae TaxID=1293975 RepID=A0AA88V8E1_9ASTE|nr:hypothetical protein RJ639_019154 [Escallonia herrerae]